MRAQDTFGLGAVLLAALVSMPASAGGGDPEAELARLRGEIQALAGNGRCDDVAQCRAIPIGKRDCGGREEYVVFSTMTAKADRLQAKALEYTRLHEEILRGKSGVGPCEIVLEPTLACIRQRCRAVEE